MGSKRRATQVSIETGIAGSVSGLLMRPEQAWLLCVLAHGAGAGMTHPFMEAVADELATRGIATLRYQFPYMERGRKSPDAPQVATATVRAAIDAAVALAAELPLIAGGKSFGGRMTSMAAAAEPLPRVEGLIYFGFPLHRPGAASVARAEHLRHVRLPMLFLQGTRDPLAHVAATTSVCDGLGARARLHVVAGGDHSFNVLKRSGRLAHEVMKELGEATEKWARNVVGR